MLKRNSLIIILILILFCISLSIAQNKRPITFSDLISFGRVSEPQISPDNKFILFTITSYSLSENKGVSSIWIVSSEGGKSEQIISDLKSCRNPRWSPDGKTIAFISSKDGNPQIWLYNLETKTQNKLSDISTGAEAPIWSPDGKFLAFISEVYPDCPADDCNKKRNEQADNNKIKAKILTTLPFRVWNSWKDNKRNHLFIIPVKGGTAKDLSAGDFDTPPIDISGKTDYTFSPDSKEICFVRNTDPLVAISTNNDLFTIPVNNGEAKSITVNKANDNQPVYSPDGKYIAYRAMKRPGFEADKYDLILYDRENNKIKNLTENIDHSINEVVWSPDSKYIYFNTEEKIYSCLYRISLNSKLSKILDNNFVSDIKISSDGKTIYFLNQHITMPPEIFSINTDGKGFKQLSKINSKLLGELSLDSPEDFWFEGAGGTKVNGFIIKPPDFNPNRKYPMIFLVHGGPQNAWSDNWTYRWNAQMFASPGYILVLINPRGSTGYGQTFCDEISGDWGGKPFEDLMKGLDYVTNQYTFIDKNKMAAAGASYGGYMMNWFLGHTDKFKCIVSHDGVYNIASMYGTTEELWFVEWDMKGTPWSNPETYEKYSPHTYAKNFKTPTLIIHGEQDFRVPVSEGFQLFTALQRQGVPSKFLYFPDEGHFVLKPQNSELWYKTVMDWWKEWLEK